MQAVEPRSLSVVPYYFYWLVVGQYLTQDSVVFFLLKRAIIRPDILFSFEGRKVLRLGSVDFPELWTVRWIRG